MTNRIRWQEAEYGNIAGYVGTMEVRLFRLQRPVLAGERWLLTADFPLTGTEAGDA